ncbi:MAG TPA: hypothetical protein VFP13_07515 [Actinomycetota bacterium]|nr:hypothetical protein [Actinomycetota bacterium]
MALRILVAWLGAVLVAGAIGSAVKTVVLPRATPSRITRSVFIALRWVFRLIARPRMDYRRRDRRLGAYAPVALIATLVTWLTLVLLGFTLIFWAIEQSGWLDALELSGSSLFTLGFSGPEHVITTVLIFVEAALGLFLLALLITYLPTLYGAFSRREVGITALEVRAGSPPSALEMIWRYWRLERLPEIHEVWAEWERWFVDVEETHTSYPALAFFRSSHPDNSWVTAAGAVLDGAALVLSSVEVRRDVKAEFCIRSGYLCLRAIADFFQIPYDPDPDPEDPISIRRDEWETLLMHLEEAGVPLKADREQAWRDFAGWRVNYDTVLIALASLTEAPPALWSSDRGPSRIRPPVLRRSARTSSGGGVGGVVSPVAGQEEGQDPGAEDAEEPSRDDREPDARERR